MFHVISSSRLVASSDRDRPVSQFTSSVHTARTLIKQASHYVKLYIAFIWALDQRRRVMKDGGWSKTEVDQRRRVIKDGGWSKTEGDQRRRVIKKEGDQRWRLPLAACRLLPYTCKRIEVRDFHYIIMKAFDLFHENL